MDAVMLWKSLIILTFEYIRRNFSSSDDLARSRSETRLIKNEQISNINYLNYNYIGVSEICEAIICVTIKK